MSKYLEFKEIPFKGKTKRFNVVSKTSFEECKHCNGTGDAFGKVQTEEDLSADCIFCNGTGKIPIILGRISWYPQWRQYTFSPGFPTVWNKECMEDIIFFITNLMKDRKIILMKDK